MTTVDILRGGNIKVGDTDPPLRVQCFTEGDDPYNLSGYSVTLSMRRSDSSENKIDASATVEQEDLGIIEYDWQSGDTDESGTFNAEIVANDGSGSVISFPNSGYFNIYIEQGLK